MEICIGDSRDAQTNFTYEEKLLLAEWFVKSSERFGKTKFDETFVKGSYHVYR
jgi:hypothetical protein